MTKSERNELTAPPFYDTIAKVLRKWSHFISSFGVWLSLVERFVRDEEAVGSNPVTPTLEKRQRIICGLSGGASDEPQNCFMGELADMKISIIIPFYQGVSYFKQCIQSVKNQNLTEYEIVLVCDCGCDALPEEWLDREPIQVVMADSGSGETLPRGVAYCRNLGMKKATGDWFYFLDADDYILPGSLSGMISMQKKTDALLVTGKVRESWFGIENYKRVQADSEKSKERVDLDLHNFLISRSLIREKNLRMEEELVHDSELVFAVKTLVYSGKRCAHCPDSTYVHRWHNDRIHLPSLSQQRKDRGREDYLKAYEEAQEFLMEQSGDQKREEIQIRLERDLIRHFFEDRGFHTGAPAHSMAKALSKIASFEERIRSYPFWDRCQIRNFRKNRYTLAKWMGKLSTIKKKKKGLLGSRIQWYRVVDHIVFSRLPIRKDWILFDSFFGKSYSDSPKYLYEYIRSVHKDRYRYIWVLNEPSKSLQKTGKCVRVKRNSLRYMYYLSRSGYRIFNVRQPSWSEKRQGVVFLETWHGTPLKKLGFDLEDILTPNQDQKQVFYEQQKEWDYLVSANAFSTETFERCFGTDRDRILEMGYPRNDILYDERRLEIAKEVKRELSIPEDKKVILYAPTWRDDQYLDAAECHFSLALDFDAMWRELGQQYVVLLRTHYHVTQQMDLEARPGFVYDVSRYEDIGRLYVISDVCITDYSSVFFDFANLQRPILFYAYDRKEYADEIRGMYFDMDRDLPGPVLSTQKEVMDALKNLEKVEEEYRQRYEQFYERFCHVDDGNASKRIVEKVL